MFTPNQLQPTVTVEAEDPVGLVSPLGAPFDVPFRIALHCGSNQTPDPTYQVRLRGSPRDDIAVQVGVEPSVVNVTFRTQDCLEESAAAERTFDAVATLGTHGDVRGHRPHEIVFRAEVYGSDQLMATGEQAINATVAFLGGLSLTPLGARVVGSNTVEFTVDLRNTGNADAAVRGFAAGSGGIQTEPHQFVRIVPYGDRTELRFNATARDCHDPSNAVMLSVESVSPDEAPDDLTKGHASLDLTTFECTGDALNEWVLIGAAGIVLTLIGLLVVGGWALLRRM